MISVTYILLTWNRKKSVQETHAKNIERAGYPIHQFIHVDNGSEPEFLNWFNSEFKPDTQVLHKQNVGIYKGWNSGLALATGSHVVMVDCDMLLPTFWLRRFVDATRAIKRTGVVCLYHKDPHLPNMSREGRMRGPPETINGVTIRQAAPAGIKFFSRQFLYKAGFWREDFGLYGLGDLEYTGRLQKTADRLGLYTYVLPDLEPALHIPDHDFVEKIDGITYAEFKKANRPPEKQELLKKCRDLGHPLYNPFARIEVDLNEKEK